MEGVSFSRILFLAAIALAIVMPVRWWVVEPIYIASPSMAPTLAVGAHLFSDKLTLRLRAPRRGDIIVFHSPVGENHDLVKRVIAVGGDTIELSNKIVLLNGAQLSEPYKTHIRPGEALEGDTLGPVTVPAESYFVLGDNRDESKDSSVWKDAQGAPIYFLRGADIEGLVRGIY